MDPQVIFNFKTDISGIPIPQELNNPFDLAIPEIAKIAVTEFQDFIDSESKNWDYDFNLQKGKMFGVLVVQKTDQSYVYLATVSGSLSRKTICPKFTPSAFDESIDDYFINRGMLELTDLSNSIMMANSKAEIEKLSEKRKLKSHSIQNQLFENYHFLNRDGKERNILDIFGKVKPPSAAGECAAPKLVQYAFKQGLKPIALAEFWWGNPKKNKERVHGEFYPACKDKCRPILGYMLGLSEK